ncbi:uncharacterized protein LAESUDRAFT_724937 [Laetiporus sulphureus 93-53]|uniref:Uncharacterized protein n=1 Tax=Laetiporus sulphureus 93-53 TaxID=1314785 RepID=A0A165EPD1_9APHY|nr:uncharacterized protein LAESUDRAFT_724937 [Laetiporus sulphureus 93-53]KZT07486.1 hypothetical protein LAESUDRAFT_724937 [Laetiporus sulphureus 93-53]
MARALCSPSTTAYHRPPATSASSLATMVSATAVVTLTRRRGRGFQERRRHVPGRAAKSLPHLWPAKNLELRSRHHPPPTHNVSTNRHSHLV